MTATSLTHRIAAGAIVIHGDRILLVRYRAGYLVCPGGAIERNESLQDTAARECLEETGIAVRPIRLVAIELIAGSRYTMQKSWFLCEYLAGTVAHSPESDAEGIVQIGWFSSQEIGHETVFPEIIQARGFAGVQALASNPVVLPLRQGSF